MATKHLTTSTRMATAIAVGLPAAETLRRANQLADPARFLNWFDDYLLGAGLLLVVWMVKRNRPNAVSWLIAAWGIGVGALALSFIAQLTSPAEPGIFPTTVVAGAKGLILAYMVWGLYLSVRASET